MKTWLVILAVLSFSVLDAASAAGDELKVPFGRFGQVTVYRQADHPSHVVLFVSGDGGWNLGVVDMARALMGLDALVVGIDIRTYLRNLGASREACHYPAADFEALSKFVQKKLAFPDYRTPVLVGYSSGATLVYGILVQSPPNTFAGAISLGFCPDLPLSKPLCRGDGLEWKPGRTGSVVFQPASDLSKPWIAFQGSADQVCNAQATAAYVRQVKNGELVLLPRVGHGFALQKNWMPQFKKAFAKLAAPKASEVSRAPGTLTDLPLVEVSAARPGSGLMAVFYSGDGGWAGLDQEVSRGLAEHGVPVIGLNTLRYFWTARTPDSAARDLERILRHYLEPLKKERIVLIGYSLGADVLPFLVNRLPEDLSRRVAQVVLVGPSSRVDFEFHLSDWLGGAPGKGFPVLPEVRKMKGENCLCLYGTEETDSICPELHQAGARVAALGGAHHFGGNYPAIVKEIVNALKIP